MDQLPYRGEDFGEDHFLTVLLRNFMRGLERYLDDDGNQAAIDRVISGASTAVVALLILWSPKRQLPGPFGIVMAIGKQLWDRLRWII